MWEAERVEKEGMFAILGGGNAGRRFVGKFTIWWPNGKKHIEGSYKRWVMNGIWKAWDENGTLVEMCVYKDHHPYHGIYVDWSWGKEPFRFLRQTRIERDRLVEYREEAPWFTPAEIMATLEGVDD